ncbi:NAD(P)H-dependent oxidoreductase [Bradyrhizobium sp. 186]|uniref:NADPH-dependent FMN reductase n=1 Tax=Bradyrhizobium sp. 186 TaxID=2782654 RepID=UPI0020008654|nr:NADPH-dependent FMN reductase [Bradyrhizobium sp. 186]UPK38254.1 NAD(P)H-dependent oxidoreductase [Bradyrhizobium sp. 186]
MEILAICGSVRAGSFNAMVVRTLPLLAPAGMKIVAAPSIESVPTYNADLQANGFSNVVLQIGDAIHKADGVIIVTPEYNYSIPGILKNAIDWVSRLPDQPFKNKPIALQSASQGVLGGVRAQYHLRQILVFVEGLVLNKPEVFISGVQNKADASHGELTDGSTRDLIKQQLHAFETFVRGIKRNAIE